MWLTKQNLQQSDSERLKHKRNRFYQAYGNKEQILPGIWKQRENRGSGISKSESQALNDQA